MEFVWAGVLLTGFVAAGDAIYQAIQTLRESEILSKREFYPLDFEEATGFHFIKDPNEKDSFNIFNSQNLLSFRIFRKQRQKSFFKEEWVIAKASDQNELATITFSSFLGKSHVFFNLSNRYSDPAHFCNSAGPNSQSHVTSSRLTSITNQVSNITPYIDSSLANNDLITVHDLGAPLVLSHSSELTRFEVRNLYKIVLNSERLSKASSFKISKNSMRYSWKANGYLQKSLKNDLDLSCERIGMVRFNNDSGTDFWLFVNEERIEAMVAITTAFTHYKSSLWNFKDLLASST